MPEAAPALPPPISSDVQCIIDNMLRLQHMAPEQAETPPCRGLRRIEEQRALCICTGSALLFNPRRPPVKPCKVSRFTRELEKPFDNGSESGPTGHACCCRKELCDVCRKLADFFWV